MKRFILTAVICLVSVILFADCPTADLTGDCFVDLADLTLLANQWLAESTECPPPDLTGDCRVDSEDFAVTSAQWLSGNRLPEMVLIPAGTFQMGNSTNPEEGDADELPVHTITLNSFAMGKYEITNGQYCAFLNSAFPSQLKVDSNRGVVYASRDASNSFPYCYVSQSSSFFQIAFKNNRFIIGTKGGKDMTNHPMVMVSWHGAAAYCNWRSQQENRELCYDLSTWTCDFTKKGYRLPTEAEWEYAARGGLDGKRFPWGDTISQYHANYWSYWYGGKPSYPYDLNPISGYHPTWNDRIEPYSSQVGSFPANGYGLCDMAGNVFERCHDWYKSYISNSQINPTGPLTGSYCVLRGGGWGYPATSCRVSSRDYDFPSLLSNHLGFRVVLKLD
jgi:formylglycine-generating enzyme required for sulfatase activity